MEKRLNVNDVSSVYRVSSKTIRHWTQVGYIPHYKYTKRILFDEEDLKRWDKKKHKKGRDTYRLSL